MGQNDIAVIIAVVIVSCYWGLTEVTMDHSQPPPTGMGGKLMTSLAVN